MVILHRLLKQKLKSSASPQWQQNFICSCSIHGADYWRLKHGYVAKCFTIQRQQLANLWIPKGKIISTGIISYHKFNIVNGNSRADKQHHGQHKRPTRSTFPPGSHNVTPDSLINQERILLPSLNVKFGIMETLDKESLAFVFLKQKFPRVSEAKVTTGIFWWT